MTLRSTFLISLFLFSACTDQSSTPQYPPPITPLTTEQPATSASLPREDWGGMPVTVQHIGPEWLIQGKKQRIIFSEEQFWCSARNNWKTLWTMDVTKPGDLIVKDGNETFSLSLMDARNLSVEPYDAGFKTGIKIKLSDFHANDSSKRPLDLTLYLTLTLEGSDEDLVTDIVATEGKTSIRQLNWPGPLTPASFDATILSHVRGVLLPKDYPLEYNPIREQLKDGSYKYPKENSISQSNVIEDWSMSWWGYQQGNDALMCIVETPDDAAQNFSHPAGGPTILGPRWRASLGKLRYQRSCRYLFLPNANYVTMAKKYRDYVQSTGLFVSLKEKIARNPNVANLIGTPLTRQGILTDFNPSSLKFSTTQPAKNHHVTTFDQRGEQFKKWKAQGLDHLNIVLTGWPHLGYDRQHPDELPPAPEAGGVDAMLRLQKTCHDLGYLFSLHDQYRDYYTDAPSFNQQFAVHEENSTTPSVAFPGSRFGQWKEGNIPYMNNWDGGKQSYMNNRLMPGELTKNYTWLADHGIKPDTIYLDVFGYVPPDEDFNPEHPTTRTDALNAHRLAYSWARHNIGGGIIGTEAGSDWTIPYTDYTSPLSQDKGIPIPLFNLVYHDAVITPYDPTDLHGLLNAGVPQIGLPRRNGGGGNPTETGTFSPEYLAATKRMAALHSRLALCEMTNHQFLTPDHKIERTTFSDGSTITVDWTKKTATINPDLP